MKVILINDMLNAGGSEKLLVNIANLLYKNKVEVEVVLFLDKALIDDQINKNISVKYLSRKGRFDMSSWIKLKSWVKDADIVHIHSRYNLRYYFMVKFILGIRKPKIVFHEHMPRFQLDFITTYLFSKVNAYVAVFSKMTEWVIEKKYIKKNKSFYLPNFVTEPETEIKANQQSEKILMIGNFWHLKNHFFALELLKNLPEFELDIYGMIYESEYYQNIKTKIIDLNLEDRVNLIEGIQDVYSIMNKYSFAIHTSTSETGPLVLIEYMQSNMPFLSFNTGDVIQTVSQYLPNIVMHDFDKEKWLISIHSQMLNIESRETIIKKYKIILENHFSEKNYFNSLHKIYQQVLA